MTLAETAKQKGCVSTPIVVDGTDLYKCQTASIMNYFTWMDLKQAEEARINLIKKARNISRRAAPPAAAARNAVIAVLKDPDSAKFGQFSFVGTQGACLTVNARNSFGGYTGKQQAHLIKEGNGWRVSSIDNVEHEQCTVDLTPQ